MFEPINVFAGSPDPGKLWGIDIEPIAEIAGKIKDVFSAIQGPDDPMLDFDERDLFRLAEEAGFKEVHLVYEANAAPAAPRDWDQAINVAPNPLVPTVHEAMEQVFTESEAREFEAYMKPRFENGDYLRRDAVAFLWAVKE